MSWLAGGLVAVGVIPSARAKTGIAKIAIDKIVVLTLMTKTLPSPGVSPPEIVPQFAADRCVAAAWRRLPVRPSARSLPFNDGITTDLGSPCLFRLTA